VGCTDPLNGTDGCAWRSFTSRNIRDICAEDAVRTVYNG
jgi:hypothetical protein